MSRRMEIAKAYEQALFAGDRAGVGARFTDDVVYWVAGVPRIGGEWRGREAVLDALWNREPGLGAADWGSEEVWRGLPTGRYHDLTRGSGAAAERTNL